MDFFNHILCCFYCDSSTFWTALTTIILAITAVIVWQYTVATYRQLKMMRHANEFTALTTIHKILTKRVSYKIRKYLLTYFTADLVLVTKKILGNTYVTIIAGVERINVNAVKSLKANKTMLEDFNNALETRTFPVNNVNVNALEAVEWTLLDFDIIALPLSMKIEAVKEVAKAYKPVLEKTAFEILPFVAIQMKLRDEKDYKTHYLHLLKYLDINTQEL